MGMENNEKKKSLLITVCVIVAAALIIGLVVYTRLGDNGTLLRSKTAAESENFEVSGTMMAYFYKSNYSTYAPYASYLGVDPSIPLKQQPCTFLENGGTWFDYFADMTKNYVSEMLSICESAHAAGLSLKDVDQAEVDATMQSMKQAAEQYGYTFKQYLTAVFGVALKESDVRACLELSALAGMYSDQFTTGLSYTDADMEAYYAAHKADFDGVDLLVFSIPAADFMEKDASGNPIGDTTTASALAQAEAEKIAAATSETEFLDLVRAYITAHTADEETDVDAIVNACYQKHLTASSVTDATDWAFSAKAGDVHMTGVDGDTNFTVYYLLTPTYRDESTNRNVRHILFATEEYEDSTKAEEVYAELEAAGFTDEAFDKAVNEYSYDTASVSHGGVYENVAQGEMTNAFNAWLFDPARQVKDHGIVESDFGWHIMQYLGEADGTAWKSHAERAMRQADYEAMAASHTESVVFHDDVINEINA